MQGIKKRSGWVLPLLIVIFFLPMILAWIMYSNHDLFGTVNRGDLISPPFAVSQFQLDYSQKLRGKWLLMLVNPGICDKNCQHNLWEMRQIRLALGKDQDRLQRAIITYQNSAKDNQLTQLLQQNYNGTFHFWVKPQSFENTIKTNVKQNYALQTGVFYIADPNGNVMMSYHPGVDPMGILKDLTRLLKVSQIG